MPPISELVGGAVVLAYVRIDERHRPTGACRHSVNGRVLGPAAGLAICQYTGERGFFLFYCDAEWRVDADTWHETYEDAEHQAEFEYEGVSGTWERTTEYRGRGSVTPP